MDVKTLMDYYSNLNAQTTAASVASASNTTNANIESARFGAEARRLDQEKQLEFFRNQMANARSLREQASAEGISAREIQARTAQGILDKTFTGTENAANRELNLKLQQLSDANAAEREKQKSLTEAPARAAQIAASEASTAESVAKTSAIGQPQPKDLIDAYTALQKQPNEGWFGMATNRDKARKVTMQVLEDQMKKIGVNVSTNPDIQEARGPEVKARYDAEVKGIDAYFDKVAKTGKMNSLSEKWALLQAKLANGLISPAQAPAAVAKFKALAKSYGVKPEEFGS